MQFGVSNTPVVTLFSHNRRKVTCVVTNKHSPVNLLPSIIVSNTSDHDTSAEDSDNSDMATIVPEDFRVEEAAATGTQAKKKKKKTTKKKEVAADANFRYSFADIPKLHFTVVGGKTFLTRGPAASQNEQDTTNEETVKKDVALTTITGEVVGRDLTMNQWVYFEKVRPDLRFGPEDRPKPSIRSGDISSAGIGKTLKDEYQTISTINICTKALWRPGNTLRDAAPTDGLYVDGQIVEMLTNIKPEQDVAPASLQGTSLPSKSNPATPATASSEVSATPTLSQKAQGKQKVRQCH